MYLKRLEMTGFKSFPDSVQIEFLPGVTAIVGPNGSGKSNIADAIRWVLGEHNPRVLRGSKMEDVIFGGSETRRALGAAEVTLVLDNSDRRASLDCDEIRVSRRVYRSGESEYLMNNSTCRLKDIRDLFLDTGVGRDAYAIVEQGRVDAILSAHSDERRLFFDEAAGVAKCKTRKQEALGKLEDVERNLVRVWDLINELSVRVESMREQAEKAGAYLSLKEQLTHLEAGLLGNRYVAGRERLQTLCAENEKLRLDRAAILAKMGKAEAELTQLREDASSMDTRSQDVGLRLTKVVAAIERCEGRLAVAHERTRLLEQEHERLAREKNDCEKRLEQLGKQLADEKSKLREAVERATELRCALEGAEAEMRGFLAEVAAEEESIEKLKGTIVGVLSEMAECRNLMSDSTARLESGQRNEARLNERLEQIRDARKTTSAEEASVAQEISRSEASRKDLERQLSELSSTRDEIDDELSRLCTASDQYHRTLSRDESRLAALQDLDKSHEGFFAGVRAVLERFEGSRGLVGAVADLIRVAPEHVVAIEAALGAGLQNIIVDSDAVAKRCIRFLKDERKGRATFLPLDLIRVPATEELEKRARSLEGVIGLATSLVESSERVRPAIDHLLGRTVVATDLDAAVAAARALNGSARIVTLDGDIVSQGGAITGGSPGSRNQGVLSRKTEIERLHQSLNETRGALTELERSVKQMRCRRTSIESDMTSLTEAAKRVDLSLAELRSNQQSLKRDLARLDADERLALEEISDLKQAVAHQSRRATEASRTLEELSAKEKQLQEELTTRQADLRARQSHRGEISEKITTLRVDVGRLEQKVRSQRDTTERLDSETASLRSRLEELSRLEAENRRAAEDTDVEARAARRDRERFSSEKRQLEQEGALLKQNRLETMAKVSECESAVKVIRAELAAVDKDISSREVETARVSESLSAIDTRLREEYMIDPDSLSTRDLGVGEKEAVKSVESLKQKIRDLGPVNTGAVDEFRETQERYGFLCSQRDDLIEAKKALNGVISEIDEETKRRFRETFEIVNKEFQQVFVNLFGGGRAHLALEDPDDLLSTGIEIYAEPPGKKLQSLSLLSGGERAMTAIALIFAMMRVNPSPFSVLDEIDAPLDDANVDRFNRLLRELSRSTQFVVVTHRKGTMEAADALYGVTMEESGVSKTVSVRLQE